jgi:hypothetical protein
MPASQPQPGSIYLHPAPSTPVCRVVFDQRGAPQVSKQGCPGEWRSGHTSKTGTHLITSSSGDSRLSDLSTLPLPCMCSLSPLLINALAPPHQCPRSCQSGPPLKAGPAAAYQRGTASGLGRLQASFRAPLCRCAGGWDGCCDASFVQRLLSGGGVGQVSAPGCHVPLAAMCVCSHMAASSYPRSLQSMFGPGLCAEPRAHASRVGQTMPSLPLPSQELLYEP